jgi:hypothetical protein
MALSENDRHADRRGAVAAQVAIALLAIMGVGAIALEGGIMQSERRRAQAVADTAALAGAAQLFKNWDSSNNSSNPNNGLDSGGAAQASALAIANANGYTSATSTITPNTASQHGIWIPPATGPNTGKAGYVEVIVQYNQRRYLSAIFGAGTIPIRARAVARGFLGPLNASLLLLSKTASPALNINGKAKISDPGRIIVDSSASGAINVNGNSGSITAGEIDVVGGLSGTTSNINAPASGSTSSVFTNSASNYMDDPLGPNGLNLPAPSTSGLQTRYPSQHTCSQNEVLQPGIYVGGILNKKTGVQMAPGTYVIEGGSFSIQNGDITSQAGGVLIYLTKDSAGNYATFDLQAQATATLAPASTGTYAGITIFQDRTAPVNTTVSLQGGAATDITGMIYAPNALVNIAGGSIAEGNYVIANTMNFNGNNNLNVPTPAIPVIASRYYGLVE